MNCLPHELPVKGFIAPYSFISALILFLLTSCYDPDDDRHIEPDFLEPEVYVLDMGTEWDSIADAGITIDFTSQDFSFGALGGDRTASVTCIIEGRKGAALFNSVEGENYADAVRTGAYLSNDTLTVTCYYQKAKNGGNLLDQSTERDLWDETDPEYNELIIENKSVHDGVVYYSGSFRAGVYRAFDNDLTPAYRFYEGTFRNVRVTMIYR